MEITNTKSVTFSSNKREYIVNNKNRLLNEYAGANGVKTGYTGLAGQCFVGAAKRDGMQLVTVVLQSGWGDAGKEQKWIDTKRLLNYGFENYKYYTVVDGEKKIGDISVRNSKTESLEAYIKGNVVVPLTEEERESVELIPSFNREMEAPIKENQVVGKLKVVIGDEVITELDIYVKFDAELNTLEYNLKKVLKYWLEFRK